MKSGHALIERKSGILTREYNIAILEGADQQGKTSFSTILKNVLHEWDVVHYGIPDENFDYHYDYFVKAQTISDRNFISEIVYTTLQGKKSMIKNLDKIVEYFSNMKTVVLYFDREEHFTFQDRDEAFTKGEILRAREIYKDVINSINLDVIRINPHDINTYRGIGKIFKRSKQ